MDHEPGYYIVATSEGLEVWLHITDKHEDCWLDFESNEALDCPAVILAGTLDLERIVEFMKGGATNEG